MRARRLSKACRVLLIASALVVGCGGAGDDPVCGDGLREGGEACDDGNTVDGDGCSAQCEVEGCVDCDVCQPIADVTANIDTNDQFFGYASLAWDVSSPGCGDLSDAKELYVTLTPDFDGDVVLSTVHPSTNVDTVIEVRQSACDGAAVSCEAGADPTRPGARTTVAVNAGQTYVALVEMADGDDGVFALSLHEAGVCEGLGSTEDITGDLLSGRQFVVDTLASTASMRGSCSAASDANPEALLTFVAPTDGVWVATTAHPDTDFDPLLYVRQGDPDGEPFCDSAEAEVACENDSPEAGVDPVLRFSTQAGRPYSLFVDGGSPDGRGQATLVLGLQDQSPALAALQGCNHTAIIDQFAFFAESGDTVYTLVDTVDAATAADFRLRIRAPSGAQVHEADDDTPCTFPPPAYSCPEHSFTVNTPGLYSVEVYVGASQSCADNSLANYELTVTVNGADAELIQFRDQ